ncbi:flagellar basal body P-ring formation chaperone FlgA [Azospirillum thermophilum]|uniref:Flagella basal body P-ring formation protein FlgA n=1 Tax=Azospirillum thermophilum TaxID=2202148 RepID=A0A2S2CV16_9PROT|nr:flagellar basal body P-ring formation chaperone FlgA [Azospirillum thermophilum]AWK88255.1 flagella basal body P-ring formation protein FlgA [Azospirillum thermophilum]
MALLRTLRRTVLALAVLAAGPALALSPADGSVESLLARELASTLGGAVPSDARVSVVLTAPFGGSVEAVRDLSYDPRSGSLRALVSSDGRIVELKAKAEILVEVPVPTRRILPGEIIGDGDLTTVTMPMERLNDTVVTSRETLLGQASRRQLPPGRLIQTSAVGVPIVVQRNKQVSLVYEDGPLQLVARGRALQDGGVGEVVRVMNNSSNIVVTGVITGPQTVAVAGSQQQPGKP